MITAEQNDPALALNFSVSDPLQGGGMTGHTPTVALRNGSTVDSYLDWTDGLFKDSGWTTKFANMQEVARGHYRHIFDAGSIADIVAGFQAVAEYRLDDGAGVIVDNHDTIRFVESYYDVAIVGTGF